MTDAKPYPKAKQLGRGERRYRRKIASPKRWAAIMDAKRGPCRVCGKEATHLAANIVPLHFACHVPVTALVPAACLALCSSLTDAEYAYAVGKLGEGAFERVYRVVLT